MSLSASDLKHSLRKTDFPFCAREALGRIEQLCLPAAHGRPPSAKHADLASELLAEFVFCEVDRRGARKRVSARNVRTPGYSSFSRLSCIQELQLLEVLCDYFAYAGGGTEASRNAVFLALFPHALQDRCRLLAKLVSMAISTKNIPVLNATGVWMQQLGCMMRGSLELAQVLVKDYFVLVPRAGSGLQDLPQLVPHFTANFLTAVAEIYTCDGAANAPPEPLLEVVTQWIGDVPILCIAALSMDAMASGTRTSPYSGLFRWTVLAPLSPQLQSLSLMYSRLHLALLESVLECRRTAQAARLEGAANLQPLAEAVRVVGRQGWPPAAQQLAMDRLVQALQLVLGSQMLGQAERHELIELLKPLPPNRLLDMVMRHHRCQW